MSVKGLTESAKALSNLFNSSFIAIALLSISLKYLF